MKAKDLLNDKTPPNLAVVGDAGCGKTALVSQLGKGAYILDFDGGMRTALTLKDPFTPLRQSVEFDTYLDKDPQNPNAWVKAKEKLRSFVNAKPPKALGIDSLTGACQAVRLYVMKTSTGNAFAQPEIQHWGMMINEIEQFLFTVRVVPCLTIITAHVAIDDAQKGGVIHYINSITKPHGKNKVAWTMDEVLYMTSRSLGANKVSYVVSGRRVDLPVRTRSNMTGDLDIVPCGLKGLLEKIGFAYDPQQD